MNADVIGTAGVLSLITQSGLTKFIVSRANSGRNAVPLFECLQTNSTAQCTNVFRDWATTMTSSNPANSQVYEIFLFNSRNEASEAEASDDENEGVFRGNKKSKKMRFTFCFNASGYAMAGINTPAQNGNYVTTDQLNGIISNLLNKQKEDTLLQRLAKIERRLNDDDDDDDDDEPESWLDKVDRVFDRIEKIDSRRERSERRKKTGGKKKQSDDFDFDDFDDDNFDDDLDDDDLDDDDILNGEDDDLDDDDFDTKSRTMERKENIRKALEVLLKADKDIDRHLLKLAKIAKTNPAVYAKMIEGLTKLKI